MTALTWTVNSNSTLDNITSDANFAAYASEEWETSRTGPFTVTGGNMWGWHRCVFYISLLVLLIEFIPSVASSRIPPSSITQPIPPLARLLHIMRLYTS